MTAASADWQISREPVFFAGDFYYPAGPTVFFDGNVMVRSGTYQNVPLYTDATLQPYSVVFVPVGGKIMRPYERKRNGELAGTVGSRAPSFPIQRDVEVSAASGGTGLQTPPLRAEAPGEPVVIAGEPRAVGTSGTLVPAPARSASSVTFDRRSTRTGILSIPGPRSNAGVYIEYTGARYYVAGPAVTYTPERFTPIGAYHGFAVYRDNTGPSDRIYVPAVEDGPLVPYSTRQASVGRRH